MARQMMRRRWGTVTVLVLGLALAGGTQRTPGRALADGAPAPLYDVVYLGTLGGNTYVTALNQAGEVAGFSLMPDGHRHAYWEYPLQDGGGQPGWASVPFDMGTLGGDESEASALTNVNGGEVVGWSDTSAGSQHAFRSGAVSVIVGAGPYTDDLGGQTSLANGVNDELEVVGNFLPAGGFYHAFRTAPGQAINPATDDLGTFGGLRSDALGINNAGQVVGEADTSDGHTHAFRTAPEADGTPGLIDLGTLGGPNSTAYAINEAGQVVGQADTSDGYQHAFRTGPNRPIDAATDDLGTLGGSDSIAYAINSAGQVVGYAQASTGASHAFLYSDGAGMSDLNDLIPAGTGWVLTEAVAINDAGQIAADGIFNGQARACLLIPLPAAPTATDPASATATATTTSVPPTATASPSATATRADSATATPTSTPPTAAASATPSSTPARTHSGPPFGPAGPSHGPMIPPGAREVTPSATPVLPSPTPSASPVPAGSPSAPPAHPAQPASSSPHRAPCRALVPPLHLTALHVSGRTLTLHVTAPARARVAVALRVLSARAMPAAPGPHGTGRRVALTLYRLTTTVTTNGRGAALVRLTLRAAGRQPLAGELTARVQVGCRAATATAHVALPPQAH